MEGDTGIATLLNGVEDVLVPRFLHLVEAGCPTHGSGDRRNSRTGEVLHVPMHQIVSARKDEGRLHRMGEEVAWILVIPVDKQSENSPDHRVYAGNGQRYEVGAAWSQVAKSSGETYLNLKIGAPEFGPNWVRARLVKLEHPGEDGTTHIALWEPRDR